MNKSVIPGLLIFNRIWLEVGSGRSEHCINRRGRVSSRLLKEESVWVVCARFVRLEQQMSSVGFTHFMAETAVIVIEPSSANIW